MNTCGEYVTVELVDIELTHGSIKAVHCILPLGHYQSHSGKVIWENSKANEINELPRGCVV